MDWLWQKLAEYGPPGIIIAVLLAVIVWQSKRIDEREAEIRALYKERLTEALESVRMLSVHSTASDKVAGALAALGEKISTFTALLGRRSEP